MYKVSQKNNGAAKHSTLDHIRQRITAIFMIPLSIWFVIAIIMIIKKPISELPWFLTSPVTLISSILFMIIGLYHGTFGVKMVIEDYISCTVLKSISLIALYAITIISMTGAVLSIFTVYILLRMS